MSNIVRKALPAAAVAAMLMSFANPGTAHAEYVPLSPVSCFSPAYEVKALAFKLGYCGTGAVLNNTSAGPAWQNWSSGVVCNSRFGRILKCK